MEVQTACFPYPLISDPTALLLALPSLLLSYLQNIIQCCAIFPLSLTFRHLWDSFFCPLFPSLPYAGHPFPPGFPFPSLPSPTPTHTHTHHVRTCNSVWSKLYDFRSGHKVDYNLNVLSIIVYLHYASMSEIYV